MVQINSSARGPVLSARSVYNFIEGEIKIPQSDVQLSISETLAKKKTIGRKKKKDLKRLDTKGKKGKNLPRRKMNEGKAKTKLDKEAKKKPVKKKMKESSNEVEDTTDDKNNKETKKEKKNKKIKSEGKFKLSISSTENSNDIEDYDDFNSSKSSNSIDASAILASIELKKMEQYVSKPVKNTKKANKNVKKNATKKSKKVNEDVNVKNKKHAEEAGESSSMPSIECSPDIQFCALPTDMVNDKCVKENNIRKSSLKTLPNGNLKSHKNSTVSFDEKSLILQGHLDMNKVSSVSKGNKTMKRKNESYRKDGQKRKKKEIRASELVSYKNDLLNKFLKSDMHEVEQSERLGATVFASMISPLTPEEFLNDYWEKSHLLIRAADKSRFQNILSTQGIDEILRKNNLSYTKNIDITSYKDGKRETHNPESRALASVVWDYYNSGCSVRMLNPQTFSNSVWKLLSTLQEFFNSFCGANVYLTPPGTQGFAPHWDDIEAFVLQLEGKKRWKVYKWRSEKETLPRESSGNFGMKDRLGDLLLNCVLEPGDLLYFPRGYIHQAEALDDAHSLHITISTYQKNAWVDLLEKLLPAALANAAEKHVEFRQGLPINYLYNSGIAFTGERKTKRENVKKKVIDLVNKMMEDAPIDAAIDQLAKGFVYDSLPPYVTGSEKSRTVFEGGERWCSEAECVINRKELTPETPIRLIRRGCIRLLVEEDSVRLFHSVENSREYHEEEPKFIEVAPEIAPGVEKLIHAYPEYITVENLPLSTLEEKMILATGLWEKGIIISENELDPASETSDIEGKDSDSPENI